MRLVVLVGLAAGCEGTPDDYDREHPVPLEVGETRSYYQIKAAILRDVRIWRELDLHLDEGRKERVAPGSEGLPPEDLEIFTIRDDPKDQHDAVTEIALYSPAAKMYLYHHIGGPKNVDVWMGPFPLGQRHK